MPSEHPPKPTCFTLRLTIHDKGRSQEELGVRTWKQELKTKQWKNTAPWPVPHSLLSLLSYTTLIHIPSTSVSSHGNCRLAYRSISQRPFLIWAFGFLNDSSLCPFDNETKQDSWSEPVLGNSAGRSVSFNSPYFLHMLEKGEVWGLWSVSGTS